MTKNPLINAMAATGYIVLVALFMNYAGKNAPTADTFLAPVAFLSLFTLSAAVMGYIFLYQPGMLYFEGRKKDGVRLFLETVAYFATVTLVLVAGVISGVLS